MSFESPGVIVDVVGSTSDRGLSNNDQRKWTTHSHCGGEVKKFDCKWEDAFT